jgi:hypothetical protein
VIRVGLRRLIGLDRFGSDRILTHTHTHTHKQTNKQTNKPTNQAHVKCGGVLLYATCSLLAQENEEVARWFLQEFGNCFRALDWGPGEVGCGRVPPCPCVCVCIIKCTGWGFEDSVEGNARRKFAMLIIAAETMS